MYTNFSTSSVKFCAAAKRATEDEGEPRRGEGGKRYRGAKEAETQTRKSVECEVEHAKLQAIAGCIHNRPI